MPQQVIPHGTQCVESTRGPAPTRASRSAFTSIELLVVIAVALLIMALMGVVWRNIEDRNKRSTAQAQITDLAAVLQDYFCETGCNPSLAAISNRLPRTFTSFSTNGIPLDPWGNEYQASANTAGQWTVFSCGPTTNESDNITAGRF